MSLDRRRLFAALAGAATAGAAAPALARDVAARRRRSTPPRSGCGRTRRTINRTSLQRAIDQRRGRGHGPAPAGRLLSRRRAEFADPRRHRRRRRTDAHRHGRRRLDAVGHRQRQHRALSGLILDGANIPLPERRGLIHLAQGRALRIADCEIVGAGRNGIALEAMDGEVTGTTISAADAAIISIDARGLRIAGNTVRGAGNGGILVWRSTAGDDGTLVVDNRIENVANKSGGSGQYGNAINVFRANNVMVRGNRIRNAAFSAVRGNAASNLQILGNTCSADRRSRALCRVRLRRRDDRQQHRRRRRCRRLGDQFQRGRPARRGAGQPDPQSRAAPARRHRSGRRRRHRHRHRSRHRGERQRHRERALYRHRRRLGPISARRHHQRQCGARRRLRHRRLGRARRRRRRDRRQYDLRRAARRHRRHGMEKAGDRRPQPRTAPSATRNCRSSATGCGEA